MNYEERITKLKKSLEHPFLITEIGDLFYLLGFQGSTGFLLLFPDRKPVFFCDGRYTTQAQEEIKAEVEIQEFKDEVIKIIKETLSNNGYQKLLVENSLRVGFYEGLKNQGLEVIPLLSPSRQMRMIKKEEEIEEIKKAVKISEEALKKVMPLFRGGVKEKDIALELDYQMRLLGGDEVAFPTIIAGGKRTALPHARPSSYSFKDNDWAIVDWGVRAGGYCADLTRMVAIGKADSYFYQLLQTVKEAQHLAESIIKEGIKAKEADEAVRNFLKDKKVEEHFTHGLGHGVGIEIHEDPRLSPKSETILKKGMIVTVEPGIYFPNWGGVRLENLIIVQEEGNEILDSLPLLLGEED
jgi:Xaa-Pro aminopeptidase